MFGIGEYVVYGMNGVCEVEAVGPMNMSGVDCEKEYYTLTPLYTKGSKVYTPVNNQKIVMRKVVDKDEAYELIDEMTTIEEIQEENSLCDLSYKPRC